MNRTPRGALSGAVFFGVLLHLAGCAGTLEDPSRFLVDAGSAPATTDTGACPDVPSQVLVPVCAIAGCHSEADMQQGLDLQSANLDSRLVGVCASGGGLLIDPSFPGRSVLYTKLTASPPYGARMPFGGAPLDDGTLACVVAWITAQPAPDSSLPSCDRDSGAGSDASSGPD